MLPTSRREYEKVVFEIQIKKKAALTNKSIDMNQEWIRGNQNESQ